MQMHTILDLQRGVQWRSLGSVGASIGDPFEGAGYIIIFITIPRHSMGLACFYTYIHTDLVKHASPR